jgi:hypothetical protein
MLEERMVHEALSDGGSAERKGRTYVMLVCFFNIRIFFEPPKKKVAYSRVDFL